MMDSNVTQLAHEAKDLLVPVLPYLISFTASAGKSALQKAGKQVGDAAWDKASALWNLLSPKIQSRPAALEAAQDVAKSPEDSDAQGAFSLQLKKLLAEDDELARGVAKFFVDSSVHISASGERSVAANNVTNSVIVTGDRGE